MEICWDGIPNHVYRMVHICCGYTNELNEKDYKKAENHSYIKLAQYGIDKWNINGLSIEDAHTRIPLQFFKMIKNIDIVLGCLKVCQTHCYTENDIMHRIEQVITNQKKKICIFYFFICFFLMDPMCCSMALCVCANFFLKKKSLT